MVLRILKRHFVAVLFSMTCIAAAQSASADTIRTKVPQAHIDAFQKDCNAKGVPAASCVCMLKKMTETREGDAALDAIGLISSTQDDAKRKAAMLSLLNRHGMRASELQAIMAPDSTLLPDIAKQCS